METKDIANPGVVGLIGLDWALGICNTLRSMILFVFLVIINTAPVLRKSTMFRSRVFSLF